MSGTEKCPSAISSKTMASLTNVSTNFDVAYKRVFLIHFVGRRLQGQVGDEHAAGRAP